MWCFIAFSPPGVLSKGVYYTSVRTREPCPLRSGWCLDLLTWPTLKNFFIRDIRRKRTAGHVTSGCWSDRLQVRHPLLVFETSLVLRTVVAQGTCFETLSQTNSDIRFRDRNPAVLCTLFTDCLLRNEYSVRLIIMMHLKQVVT